MPCVVMTHAIVLSPSMISLRCELLLLICCRCRETHRFVGAGTRALVGRRAAARPVRRGRWLGRAEQLRLHAAMQPDVRLTASRLGPGITCRTDRRRHPVVPRHGHVPPRIGGVRRDRPGQISGAEPRANCADKCRGLPCLARALQLQAASWTA
eukprot:COSAG02_NODE_2780_length_8045_cov_78.691040_4_plen_154_part_00